MSTATPTTPALPTSTAGLTPEQVDALSAYGYVPTEWVCIMYVALFSITTATHLGQAIYTRCWWLLPTVGLCGALEIFGWAGRLWSAHEVLKKDPFMMQIVATILGPTPLLAANFIVMGRIVGKLGPAFSRLSPRLYSILFLSCDIVSLIVQGVGGGIAASATDHENADLGGNIMLGGIAFQIVVITFFTASSAEFLWRYWSNKPISSTMSTKIPNRSTLPTKLQLALYLVVASTTLLFIRAIYRTIELSDGWGGEIIKTEIWFNIFDAAMVVVAMYLENVLHPGWLLAVEMDEGVYKLQDF
ncbi:RTA1-domain-containing protein [Schizophyllum commune H4-8]|nr:RTA1-domain-containing protein [Schizophyllum commune H4-8]KAI5887194.1 RTA1-domain-containing protein [Schizophyllum commune H4-8]